MAEPQELIDRFDAITGKADWNFNDAPPDSNEGRRRVQDFLSTQAKTGAEWGTTQDRFKQQFGQEMPDTMQEGYKRIGQAHELEKARDVAQYVPEEGWARRHMIPGVSLGIRAGEAVSYGRAMKRFNEGKPEPGDTAIIAGYEHIQKLEGEQNETFGQKLGNFALGAPAMGAELMTGAGVGQAVKVALPRFAAGLTAGTAATPSLWLEKWIGNNTEQGRDPLHPKGFPHAFGLGLVQNAVLGQVAGKADAVSGVVNRQLTKAAIGVGEQGATDYVTGNVEDVARKFMPEWVGKQSHYGTVGDLLTGQGGEALKEGTTQFLTFLMFGAMHEAQHGSPDAVRAWQAEQFKHYQEWLRQNALRGNSPEAAGANQTQATEAMQSLLEKNPAATKDQVHRAMAELPEGPVREFGNLLASSWPESPGLRHDPAQGPQPGIEPPVRVDIQELGAQGPAPGEHGEDATARQRATFLEGEHLNALRAFQDAQRTEQAQKAAMSMGSPHTLKEARKARLEAGKRLEAIAQEWETVRQDAAAEDAQRQRPLAPTPGDLPPDGSPANMAGKVPARRNSPDQSVQGKSRDQLIDDAVAKILGGHDPQRVLAGFPTGGEIAQAVEHGVRVSRGELPPGVRHDPAFGPEPGIESWADKPIEPKGLTHSEREKEVLRRRRLDPPHTLQQIADDLGITRERVRQIEAKALKKEGEFLSIHKQSREAQANAILDRLEWGDEEHGHFDPETGHFIHERVSQQGRIDTFEGPGGERFAGLSHYRDGVYDTINQHHDLIDQAYMKEVQDNGGKLPAEREQFYRRLYDQIEGDKALSKGQAGKLKAILEQVAERLPEQPPPVRPAGEGEVSGGNPHVEPVPPQQGPGEAAPTHGAPAPAPGDDQAPRNVVGNELSRGLKKKLATIDKKKPPKNLTPEQRAIWEQQQQAKRDKAIARSDAMALMHAGRNEAIGEVLEQARAKGIKEEDIRDYADDLRKQDKVNVEEHNAALDYARELLRKQGFDPSQIRRDRSVEDPSKVPGLADIAEKSIAPEFANFFPPGIEEELGGHAGFLFEKLKEGNLKPLTVARSYKESLRYFESLQADIADANEELRSHGSRQISADDLEEIGRQGAPLEDAAREGDQEPGSREGDDEPPNVLQGEGRPAAGNSEPEPWDLPEPATEQRPGAEPTGHGLGPNTQEVFEGMGMYPHSMAKQTDMFPGDHSKDEPPKLRHDDLPGQTSFDNRPAEGMGAAGGGGPDEPPPEGTPGARGAPEPVEPGHIAQGWFSKFKDFLKSFSQQQFPTVHRLSRAAGEALSAAANAKNASKATWDELSNLLKVGDKRLADLSPEEARAVGAVWLERRMREYRDYLRLHGKDFSQVGSLIGQEGSPLKTEADYKAGREALWSFFEAVKQEWTPEVESNFKDVLGLDPEDAIFSPSQLPGLPINAIAIPEGEAGIGVVRTGKAQGMENLKIRKPSYMRAAALNGAAYDVDVQHMMQRTLNIGIPAARRAEFIRTALAEGIITKVKGGEKAPKDWPYLGIDPARGMPGLEPNARYYVHPETYKEVIQGLGIGERPGQTLASATKPIVDTMYSIGLLAPVEVLTHVANNFTALLRDGMGAPIWNLKDTFSNAFQIMSRDPLMLKKVKELAEIGASFEHESRPGLLGEKAHDWLKPYTLGVGDPTYRINQFTSKFIDVMQKAIRVQLGEAYDGLVKQKMKVDTDQAKRDFINQAVGNYNSQASNRFTQFLKDTGLQSFATAATTFTVQGLKTALGGAANAQATSTPAALQLRAQSIMKLLPFLLMGPVLNYVRWGQAFPAQTPAFAVKTREDDDGTAHTFDQLKWTGLRRGWRALGLNALIEGAVQGKSSGEMADRAAKDWMMTGEHFMAGPPVQFLHTVMTGENALGHKIAPQVSRAQTPEGIARARAAGKPEPGSSQYWENLKAAAKNVNPLVGTFTEADRPRTPRTLVENIMQSAGPFGEQKREAPKKR